MCSHRKKPENVNGTSGGKSWTPLNTGAHTPIITCWEKTTPRDQIPLGMRGGWAAEMERWGMCLETWKAELKSRTLALPEQIKLQTQSRQNLPCSTFPGWPEYHTAKKDLQKDWSTQIENKTIHLRFKKKIFHNTQPQWSFFNNCMIKACTDSQNSIFLKLWCLILLSRGRKQPGWLESSSAVSSARMDEHSQQAAPLKLPPAGSLEHSKNTPILSPTKFPCEVSHGSIHQTNTGIKNSSESSDSTGKM